MRGVCARAHRQPRGAAAKPRLPRKSLAVAFSALESPAHRWCAPVQWTLRTHCNGQRWSLHAGCLELPRAFSGCLVPAATFFRRPGDYGCFPLGPVGREREANSTWAWDRRGGWRLIATDDASTLRLLCGRVKSLDRLVCQDRRVSKRRSPAIGQSTIGESCHSVGGISIRSRIAVIWVAFRRIVLGVTRNTRTKCRCSIDLSRKPTAEAIADILMSVFTSKLMACSRRRRVRYTWMLIP